MKYIIVSIAILISIYSKISSSATILTECSTCSSSLDYESKAEFKASEYGGVMNDITIINFYTSTHKKYRVVNITNGEVGTRPDITVSPITPTAAEIVQVNKAQNAWTASLIEAYDVDIPADIADSAYDLVGSSKTRNAVMDYTRSNASLIDRFMWEYFQLTHVFGINDGEPYVINLNYDDGSKSKISWDKVFYNSSLNGDFIELVDMEGNTILLTKSEILEASDSVTLSNEENIANYTSALGRLNITISIIGGSNTGGSTGTGTGSSPTLACTTSESADGKVITVTCKTT